MIVVEPGQKITKQSIDRKSGRIMLEGDVFDECRSCDSEVQNTLR